MFPRMHMLLLMRENSILNFPELSDLWLCAVLSLSVSTEERHKSERNKSQK